MRKIMKGPLAGLIICGMFFSGHLYAGEALEQINAEVEETAAKMDIRYGVLLTTAERTELKHSLIVNKVAATKVVDSQEDVVEQTNSAIEVYGITDPSEQRKLLIKFEAQYILVGGSVGVEPP
jgi:hypothetical protein